MKYKPTTKGLIAVIVISIGFLVMGYIETHAAGQQCDWVSDCGFNEKCKTVPYHQRDYNAKSGICVPEDW